MQDCSISVRSETKVTSQDTGGGGGRYHLSSSGEIFGGDSCRFLRTRYTLSPKPALGQAGRRSSSKAGSLTRK